MPRSGAFLVAKFPLGQVQAMPSYLKRISNIVHLPPCPDPWASVTTGPRQGQGPGSTTMGMKLPLGQFAEHLLRQRNQHGEHTSCNVLNYGLEEQMM
eukprot:6194669-Pleurochrysis_carterae.AAC.5